MNCPRCNRPVALARPACLYCGAPLPPAVVAEATVLGHEPLSSPSVPDAERLPGAKPSSASVALAHVILDLGRADAQAVAAALDQGVR